MNRPTVLASDTVFDGFFKLRKELLQLPDGKTHTYLVLSLKSDAVTVVAFTDDQQIIVNKEYRHPVDQELLSLPGGYLEPTDDDPVTAAARELKEETGYESSEMTLLGTFYPYPGISDQKIHVVTAHNATKTATPALEPCEFVETTTMSLDTLMQLIDCGHPVDGILLSALFKGLQRPLQNSPSANMETLNLTQRRKGTKSSGGEEV